MDKKFVALFFILTFNSSLFAGSSQLFETKWGAFKTKVNEFWQSQSERTKKVVKSTTEISSSIVLGLGLNRLIITTQGDALEPQLFVAGLCAAPITRNAEQVSMYLEQKVKEGKLNPKLKSLYSGLLRYGLCFGTALGFSLTGTLTDNILIFQPIILQFLFASYFLFLRDLADFSGRVDTQAFFNQLLQGKEKLAEGAIVLTQLEENQEAVEEFIKLLEGAKLEPASLASSKPVAIDIESNGGENHE